MGKKIVIFSILCLLFLCLNYTYSVFSNKIVGTMEVSFFSWYFQANVTDGTVFKDGYKLYLSGSSGSFDVELNNNYNSYAASYSIEVISDNLSSNVKFYTDSNYTEELLNNTYSGNIYDGYSSTVTLYYKSDNTINDNILVKINASVLELAVMNNGSSAKSAFWSNTYKKYIKTINFGNDLSNLPSSCTGDSDLCWDVSYDSNQEKRVYAYLVDSGSTDSSSNTLYNLYIVSATEIFAPTDCSYMFNGLASLVSIDFNDNFNTYKATNMRSMFAGSVFTNLDLSSFDTSRVTTMVAMFYNCSSLTSLDLSSFNTSNVTNMQAMFGNCSSLTSLNLSSFNTSKVNTMIQMFQNCTSLISLDLSGFNTQDVNYMVEMFYNCSSLTNLDISSFDTSKIKNEYMQRMFYNCSSLTSLDLSSFDTSNVTSMWYMFYNCSSLINLNLSSFNTSKVTDMRYMFYNCSSLTNLDLSNFDISNTSGMDSMFEGCSSLQSLGVSIFTISTPRNANQLFYNCSNLTVTINVIISAGAYNNIFTGVATKNGAKITVNYSANASSLVDNMIATKSSNSNVVKGSLIEA